jgi:hypothetical protein
MTTQAADNIRTYRDDYTINEVPAVASDIIYRGSAVGDTSGTARPLVAGDAFLGFADATADNSAGSASAINVRVRSRGYVKLAITSVASTDDIGATVYASDDNTFTLASTSNSSIGKIVEWVSSTTAWVYFEAVSLRSI